ncbi:MAG: hypothetical protein ACRD4X_12730 [Candidatus Acidiferrales bacterium]
MAAASFSLTALVQDVFQLTEAGQQQTPALNTPVNANLAQNSPAQADTVTLANKAPEDQQAGQDSNSGRFDQAAFLGAGLFIGANNAEPNRQAQPPSLPVLLPEIQTQKAPASRAPVNSPDAAASPAANAGAIAAAIAANLGDPAPAANATAASDSAASTPQEELQQLDQSLQQLGINPQSISIFNRMAMLLYANDPTALRLLVQTLQSAASQQGTGQPATSVADNETQAVTQTLLPAASQSSVAQPSAPSAAVAHSAPPTQTAPQVEALAIKINFTDVQTTLPTQPPQTSAGQSPSNATVGSAAAQPNTLSVQIEELQLAFQAVDIQLGRQPSSDPAFAAFGNSLNVTA